MTNTSEVAAVAEANLGFYRAFESLDTGQMEAVWAQDDAVKCIHPGWALIQGPEAVMQSWEQIFNAATMMQFTVTGIDVTVEGEWAYVACTENLTSVIGGRVTEAKVQATNIYRKRAGRWRMVHHHGSPVM